MEQIWAPWRLEYIKQADELPGCIFCLAAEASDEDGLLVHRGERAFVLLNKFPYVSGHLMVAPFRHVGEFGELENEEALEIHRLAAEGMGALASVYQPQGYNLGWNLGRVAGAGVIDHVHLHVVPRWAGDTNFMPVLADVKVLPEHLLESRRSSQKVGRGKSRARGRQFHYRVLMTKITARNSAGYDAPIGLAADPVVFTVAEGRLS